MNQINVISFPRSGQHLLQSILEYVYKEHNINYSFCEFYNCCNVSPCKKDALFQKNHDFNNKIKISNNKYIILYRKDIILQLESYYRYDINTNNKKYNFDDLINFINNKRPYYNNFVKKWTTKPNNEYIFVIEYYDLINIPVEVIYNLFSFLNPNIQINKEIIDNIVNKDFLIKNKSCINNNISHKITELNKMNTDMYNRIKDILFPTNNNDTLIQNFYNNLEITENNIILTFVNKKYIDMFNIFYNSFSKLNISSLIVVSLDNETYSYLKNKNINTILIPYNTKNKFWRFRLNTINSFFKIFKKNIIHTDSDCFWFKNIIEKLETLDCDIIGSLGDDHPLNIYNKLKFVLCCGFFYIKYNDRTINILDKMINKHKNFSDDQVLFNNYIFNNKIKITTYTKKEDNFLFKRIKMNNNIILGILHGSIISRKSNTKLDKLYCYHPHYGPISLCKRITFIKNELGI